MPAYEELLKRFPAEAQEIIDVIWSTLPESERGNFLALLASLPADQNIVRLLLKMSAVQIKTTLGHKRKVAIVGPANVGKSTLYNQFIASKTERAEVSPLPGTTRINQEADTGLFSMIDTPGADSVGDLGETERQQALDAARQADFLIILFDAIQGVKQTEQQLFEELSGLNKPYIVALNKTDLIGKQDLRGVIERCAVNLHLKPEQIIAIAAKDGRNVSEVLMAIVMVDPGMVVALGQALPQYRWQLAWRSIVSAATISAAIALAPLPILDFGPLLATQSLMVLGIARIYNYKITLGRARELVATFGLGFLGRTLFQQLSKLIGVPGWLLSAAIAASITVVMGYAAVVWFSKGERLSSEAMKRLTQTLTQTLLDSLRSLGKGKPGRKTLQDRIAETLENSPMAENPTLLEQAAQNPGVPSEPAAGAAPTEKSS